MDHQHDALPEPPQDARIYDEAVSLQDRVREAVSPHLLGQPWTARIKRDTWVIAQPLVEEAGFTLLDIRLENDGTLNLELGWENVVTPEHVEPDWVEFLKPTPIEAAVAALDAIDGDDGELAHKAAEAILLEVVDPRVREALERLQERAAFWAWA